MIMVPLLMDNYTNGAFVFGVLEFVRDRKKQEQGRLSV